MPLPADPSWNLDSKGNNAQREAVFFFENLYYILEGEGEKAFVIENLVCNPGLW